MENKTFSQVMKDKLKWYFTAGLSKEEILEKIMKETIEVFIQQVYLEYLNEGGRPIKMKHEICPKCGGDMHRMVQPCYPRSQPGKTYDECLKCGHKIDVKDSIKGDEKK